MKISRDEECPPTGLYRISISLAASQRQDLAHHGKGLCRFTCIHEKLGDVQ